MIGPPQVAEASQVMGSPHVGAQPQAMGPPHAMGHRAEPIPYRPNADDAQSGTMGQETLPLFARRTAARARELWKATGVCFIAGRSRDGHVVAMGWTRRTLDSPKTHELGPEGYARAKRIVVADGAIRARLRLGTQRLRRGHSFLRKRKWDAPRQQVTDEVVEVDWGETTVDRDVWALETRFVQKVLRRTNSPNATCAPPQTLADAE